MRDATSMGYRDDLDAARARASALDAKVSALEASKETDAAQLARLKAELAAARKEAEALAAYAPGSAALRAAPYRLVIALGAGLAVATAVAGSQSESLGVLMSYFAALALGAGCAGWIAARSSRLAGLIGAALGGLGALAAAFVFYVAIWPEL